ncbi:hypothetical protein TKK_0019318 [Trichogramma kaykai]
MESKKLEETWIREKDCGTCNKIFSVILLIPLVIILTHKLTRDKELLREKNEADSTTPKSFAFQIITQEDDGYVVTEGMKNGTKVTYMEARSLGKSSNHESEASPGEFPYHAAIFEGNEYICSGSLISRRHVLTAAQCVVDIKQKIKIQLGHNLKRGLLYDVDGVSRHRHYRGGKRYHKADVAIIRMKKSIVTSNFVRPIALPEAEQPSGFFIFYTTGYGVDVGPESVLRKMPLRLVPNSDCYNVSTDNEELQFANDIICTRILTEYDSCEGDIGGALVDGRKNVIRGIASSGDDFCNHPDIFINVTDYLDYIKMEISSDKFSGHHPSMVFNERIGAPPLDRNDQVGGENNEDDYSWSPLWVKVLTTIFGGMR